jgi:hypothetical protein
MGTPVELMGRYGSLEVVGESREKGRRVLLCQCDCGSEVSVRLDHLRSGRVVSCGRCGLEWDGERRTLREWAKVAGLTEGGLRARLKVMGMGEALRRHRR